MNRKWIRTFLGEARGFATTKGENFNGWEDVHNDVELIRRARALSKCIDAVLGPGLGAALFLNIRAGQWELVRDTLDQALYEIDMGEELDAALGPAPGPTLRADAMHPTVWGAVASLWRSNHRREAVVAAATAVNAALQDKLGRRDISNTALVREAFTLNAPVDGKPRLRLWPPDGSDTYTSVHDGARDFGCGCFQALRNPAAHELPEENELEEQLALEQLAAFSILARWIEAATLDVSAGDHVSRYGGDPDDAQH